MSDVGFLARTPRALGNDHRVGAAFYDVADYVAEAMPDVLDAPDSIGISAYIVKPRTSGFVFMALCSRAMLVTPRDGAFKLLR